MDTNSFEHFYSRQIGCLGIATQKHLQSKSIALVGLGGLGSHILQVLSLYGVGEIRLIDGDSVAIHNLHRQPLYRIEDEGQLKANCALKYCEARNPHTNFVSVSEFISEENISDIINGVDIIMDGADSHAASQIINDHACANEIPLIAASVEGRKGYVGAFHGGIGGKPCHTCLFPDFPDNVPTCADVGVDPLAVSLTANVQANITIKALLGEDIYGQIFNIDAHGLRLSSFKAKKDKTCAVCKDYKGLLKKEENMNFKIVSDLNGRPLVDVRSAEEFTKSPRKAINVPLDKLVADPNIMPQEDVVLCCAAGVRSEQAAYFLKDIGFGYDIQILDQGQRQG